MMETTEETKVNSIWQKVKILSIPVALLTGILIICSGIFLVLLYIVLRPKSSTSIPNKDQFTLATIGDWGSGTIEQFNVAEVLDVKEKQNNFDFIVSCGDNFYWNGIENAVDPLIAERFENIYANKYESLKDKTWLVSLGNHDWRKDPWAQVAYGNRYNEKWVMPDLFWKKELLIENKYHVQLIFLDTTRFHDGHRRDYPQVGRQSKQEHVDWLKKVLEEGEGKYQWRFVYGHHIMYSGGDYGDFGHQNMTDFENLFVKHKIDAYFCGHQHILQHLVVPYQQNAHEIDYVVTGSGGQTWSNLIRTDHRYNKFALGRQEGFVIHKFSKSESSIEFIGKNGQSLYTTKRTKTF